MINHCSKATHHWHQKCAGICYIMTLLVFLQQIYLQNSKKLVKIAKIEEENLCNIWTTRWLLMKFLGKVWLVMTLKVTKVRLNALFNKHNLKKKQRGAYWSSSCFMINKVRKATDLGRLWPCSNWHQLHSIS